MNMEPAHLSLLYKTLDDIRHENGVEYWYARELCPILGYVKFENFEGPITRARDACKNSGGDVQNNFADVRRKIPTGPGAERVREVADLKLTRYACYLIALNGNPRKSEIAFAQAYFITQTRKIEVLQLRMQELERLDAREQLKITEKEFSDMAFSRGVDGPGIAHVRSAGDEILFGGKRTEEMKAEFGITKNKPLADILPNVTLKAKDLATAMTNENVRKKNLNGKSPILDEHKSSNTSVRGALTRSGIYPERLPPAEDIRLIEARHRKENKALKERQRRELSEASRKSR